MPPCSSVPRALVTWASGAPGKILPVRLPSTCMRGANPASHCTGLAWCQDLRPCPERNPLELEIRKRLEMRTLLPSRSEAVMSPDTSCLALRKGWLGRERRKGRGREGGWQGGRHLPESPELRPGFSSDQTLATPRPFIFVLHFSSAFRKLSCLSGRQRG